MIKRRIFAAIALIAFAIGSSLFWNDGAVKWVSIGINLGAALLGFILLHFKWRAREKREVSPKKAQEIFS